MPDTQQTKAELLTLYADNDTGNITAQDGREFILSTVNLLPEASTDNFIVNQSPSVIPLTIQGAESQSANLIEFQGSDSTVLAKIDSAGNITATSFIGDGSGLTGLPSGEAGYTNLFTYGGLGTTPSSGQIQDNGTGSDIGSFTWNQEGGIAHGTMTLGVVSMDDTNDKTGYISTTDNTSTDRSSALASVAVGFGITITDTSGGTFTGTLSVWTLTTQNSLPCYQYQTTGGSGSLSFNEVYTVSFTPNGGSEFQNITEIYINKLDRNGVDVSAWLATIASGDSIRFSNDDASIYAFFDATGVATLSGSVYGLPVSYTTATDGSGSFSSGSNLNVSWIPIAQPTLDAGGWSQFYTYGASSTDSGQIQIGESDINISTTDKNGVDQTYWLENITIGASFHIFDYTNSNYQFLVVVGAPQNNTTYWTFPYILQATNGSFTDGQPLNIGLMPATPKMGFPYIYTTDSSTITNDTAFLLNFTVIDSDTGSGTLTLNFNDNPPQDSGLALLYDMAGTIFLTDETGINNATYMVSGVADSGGKVVITVDSSITEGTLADGMQLWLKAEPMYQGIGGSIGGGCPILGTIYEWYDATSAPSKDWSIGYDSNYLYLTTTSIIPLSQLVANGGLVSFVIDGDDCSVLVGSGGVAYSYSGTYPAGYKFPVISVSVNGENTTLTNTQWSNGDECCIRATPNATTPLPTGGTSGQVLTTDGEVPQTLSWTNLYSGSGGYSNDGSATTYPTGQVYVSNLIANASDITASGSGSKTLLTLSDTALENICTATVGGMVYITTVSGGYIKFTLTYYDTLVAGTANNIDLVPLGATSAEITTSGMYVFSSLFLPVDLSYGLQLASNYTATSLNYNVQLALKIEEVSTGNVSTP